MKKFASGKIMQRLASAVFQAEKSHGIRAQLQARVALRVINSVDLHDPNADHTENGAIHVSIKSNVMGMVSTDHVRIRDVN
jgi:hypothetical protein